MHARYDDAQLRAAYEHGAELARHAVLVPRVVGHDELRGAAGAHVAEEPRAAPPRRRARGVAGASRARPGRMRAAAAAAAAAFQVCAAPGHGEHGKPVREVAGVRGGGAARTWLGVGVGVGLGLGLGLGLGSGLGLGLGLSLGLGLG